MIAPLFAQQEAPLFRFTLAPLMEDNGVPLAVMGILVVFLALSLVIAFISALPRLFPAVAADSAEATAAPPRDAMGEDEETVAVIAAAVAATLDHPHRVVKISGLTPGDLGWSLEGRMQHHQSHNIHRRKH